MRKIDEPCIRAGCVAAYYGRGMCRKHYDQDRWLRDDHWRDKSRAYQQTHRSELNKKSRETRNPEVVRRGARARRARKQASVHIPYTEGDVLERYGSDCHLCGKAVDLSAPRSTRYPGWQLGLHLDHLELISHGGPDTIDNVRPAHGICNLTRPKPRTREGGP